MAEPINADSNLLPVTPEATPVVVPEVKAEPVASKEPTIAEVLKETPAETKEEAPTGIPEAAFLAEKKARKSAERELKTLRDSIKEGATPSEVSDSVAAIAAKYEIQPEFLTEFAGAIRKDVEQEVEERIGNRVKNMEQEKKADDYNKAFDSHFEKVLDEMPEYKGIVNKDVIKSLSLNPANRNKTFAQIVENTYGNAIGGKRTLETTTPRGGELSGTVDIDKAQTDPAYFSQIAKSSELLKQYNDGLIERLSSHL